MGDCDDSTIRITGDNGIGPATVRTLPAVGAHAVPADRGAKRPDASKAAVLDPVGDPVGDLVGDLGPGTRWSRGSGPTP